MKKFLWIDAIGMLDENIIAENIEMKERFARNRRGGIIKRPWRRMAVVAACLAVAVSIGVCVPLIGNVVGDNGEDSGTEQTQGESEDDGKTLPLDEDWGGFVPPIVSEENGDTSLYPVTYVTDLYRTNNNSSMVLAEFVGSGLSQTTELNLSDRNIVLESTDGDAISPPVYENAEDYIFVQVRILKDYYENIPSSIIITIPIDISSFDDVTKITEDIMKMLQDNDKFIIYLQISDDENSFLIDGKITNIQDCARAVGVTNYQIIPINNGRANCDALYTLLDKYRYEVAITSAKSIVGMDTFISQSMPLHIVERNIEILKQWYEDNQISRIFNYKEIYL